MDEAIRNAMNKSKSATATGGGSYFENGGDYVCALERAFWKKNADEGHVSFIAEWEIVSAKKTEDWCEPHAVGDHRNTVIKFAGPGARSAPGNMKAVVLALLNMTQTELDAAQAEAGDSKDVYMDFVEQLTSDSNPLRGVHVRNKTYRKASKKQIAENGGVVPEKKKQHLRSGFEAIPGQTADAIKAERERLDGVKKAEVAAAAEGKPVSGSSAADIMAKFGK